MYIKEGVLLLALVAGCWAYPALETEEDMSIFFEHVDPEARLVGGTQAPIGSHPHMGVLAIGGLLRNLVCGSSVISERTVLTAAHCITAVISGGSLSHTLRVTVGTNSWNIGGMKYAFERFVIHPDFDANTIKNDIGVLITSGSISMNNLIKTIAINYDWIGDRVNTIVAGWGRISTNGHLSTKLLQLNTTTIDGNRCVRDVASAAASLNMRAPHVDPAIELCTFHSRNHGICNGDSGSALVLTDRGQQVGIVAWGLPCALGAPDVFVRVSAYRNWIQSNTVS